jgi:hypothetical protein
VPSGRAGPEGPPPEVLARFAGARVARLATTTPEGPRLVPVTFAWHRGTAVWAVDRVKPKRHARLRRLDDLAADARVALLADHYAEDWAAAALDALAGRYPVYRAERPPGPVVAVTPRRWVWWSAT